ncbi:DUF4129 domain-containing protein [Kribbella sp. CA-293567]|uniref:DUF4129 domain-containing protein n=1 Tax=Kribbella sp. CA-293567 TaxID=3002436 RepID=UPI0022DD2291|nr:DUF4129 domain-containing protein [Kribbella sp. CA-293567]WBQ04064.1 DUF4129 domain-containing protein [Kribbella sp. CA-293567]
MQPSRRSALAVALVLALGVAAVALVVLASAGGSVRPYSESTATAAPRELPTPTPDQVTPPQQLSPPPRKEVEPFETPAWVTFLWQAVFYAVATILLLLLLRALYRMLRKVELPTPERSDSDWERLKVARLAEAVESGLAAIDSGTATDGVIACWVALEDAAASAGVARQPSETPAEFTVRVLGVGGVSEPELLRLAQLYREARYSTHGSSEDSRNQARAALVRLQEELAAATARRTPAQPGQPEDDSEVTSP